MSVKTEDMQYIEAHLSDAEKRKLGGATMLVTGCGGFLGYYFMNFFQSRKDALGIRKDHWP